MALLAAPFLLQKLSEILLQEASFLLGVTDKVRSIRNKLEWMTSFLKDVDGMPRENERAKLWVSQIREVAYDAEGIINTFIHKIERHQRQIPESGFVGCLGNFVLYSRRISAIHDVGIEIDNIKRRLDDISANRSEFGVADISGFGSTTRVDIWKEKRARVAEEADVVGLEDDARMLVQWLFDGEARRAVVSITGMGGMGKTTLAKKVYKKIKAKQHFDFYAWVSVSQEYRLRDIFGKIIKNFTTISQAEIETTAEGDLQLKLYEYLEGRRYLVVVDDIWTREAWDGLAAAFPERQKGSRVLLTTRNEEIAKYADVNSMPHKMRFLEEEESWTLFCRKALPRNLSSCPSNLEELGRKIVSKCGGLPLAVAVLGGVLSRKEKSVSEWDKVLKSTEWWLNESEDQISGILALSYHDLPYYLKPCFLYFAAFPEDTETPVDELISLWLAEGFIQRRGEEEFEDVAEDYIQELADRSMIQAAKRNSNATVEKCRIHDLLRDLAISKAKEERFLDRYGNREQAPSNMVRRLVVTSHGISKYISLHHSTLHLRSFLRFSAERETLGKNHLKLHSGGFRFLWVMDLRGIEIFSLPDEIGSLNQLRYLCVKDTEIRSLPSSICCLYNLQTLDARSTSINKLPNDFWKMENLRHLRLYNKYTSSQCRINKQMPLNKLSNLQTLASVEAGLWIQDLLVGLTNLRELDIQGNLPGFLPHSIARLVCLRSLKLITGGPSGGSSIPALTFPNHQHLYKMNLYGRLFKPPEFPPNLTELELWRCELEEDQLEVVANLPNLKILGLFTGAYSGEKIVFSTQTFLALNVLCLRDLEFEEWEVQERAMPKLKCLSVGSCKRLKMFPDGFQHITTIQELKFYGMSDEFTERIQMNGPDWVKIQHVPSVII